MNPHPNITPLQISNAQSESPSSNEVGVLNEQRYNIPDNTSNTSTDSSLVPESPNQIHIDIHNTADIELGDIHEENTLLHYTDSHFTHLANTDLRRLRDEYTHTTNA